MNKVSIIVPFKEFDTSVKECVEHCLRLEYACYDIILLPDGDIQLGELDASKIQVVTTGSVYPAIKRNIGARMTDAAYYAFIDSDAYPVDSNWLNNACSVLDDSRIGCVGGPNYTPPGAPLMERIGTEILYSKLGVGAFPTNKSKNGKYREIKELASSNLIVRASAFKKAGGFYTRLLTAEDAYLCFMIAAAGYKVVWADQVAVYHHRRLFPWAFLKSIYVYGRDKAVLLKLTLTLDKFYYFVPSAFLIFLVFGALLSCYSHHFRILYAGTLLLYFLLVLIQSVCFTRPLVCLYGLIGIPLTHIYYGFGFIYGMMKRHENKK